MSARKPQDAPQTPEAARAADLVNQANELEENPRDTTVDGGKYIVNDVEVDANGNPLKGKKTDD
ncbi:MAG: hypothetical protein M3440_06945 [Chloroflexota bacterium]|nr:hypothetical protein [Chloroflexota bacterium]